MSSRVSDETVTELLATVHRLDAQYLYWLGQASKQQARAEKAEAEVIQLRERLATMQGACAEAPVAPRVRSRVSTRLRPIPHH